MAIAIAIAIAIYRISIKIKPIFQNTPLIYKSPHLLPLTSSLTLRCSSSSINVIDEGHFIPNAPGDDIRIGEWKKLSSKEVGISTSVISEPARVVLKKLKKNGHEVYLVGGCVRDLILRRVPKDFDILTSAELREVTRTFSHCQIVGKRFPICHVHIGDHIVEVSSFSTNQHTYKRNPNYGVAGPIGCDEKDKVRWRNCMQRDFTVNGLMFDPFTKFVFDYFGGIEDIRKAKLRTIVPASISFHEDCARILRAIRIAARSRLSIARETAKAIRNLSSLILRLDRGRILMEINYMLAYGSAEASLRLLWKFGLLELLLPHQAAYFVRCGFRRRDKGSNMLLAMFANLDKLLAPDQPCNSSLWVTILAFHKALSDNARTPSVIAAFALAVNNGGDIAEAVNIARLICRPNELSFCELLEPQNMDLTVLRDEVMSLAAAVSDALSDMTNEKAVSKALAKYPQAPYSDMVFIPLGLYLRICRILDCVGKGKEMGFLSKRSSKIDYQMLAIGELKEVRHIFARVVFDTLYPLNLVEKHNICT